MNIIEKMLTGQLEMSEFIVLLKDNREIQNAIKTLVPKDAVDNKENSLWKKLSFDTLKRYNFNLLALLSQMCRFDNSIPDNLNIFATIRRVYCFSCPDLVCTKKYEEMFGLYLDAIRDCFDGPEVRSLVYEIIEKAFLMDTKKKRLEQAKEDIKKYFHIVDARRPRWINGPEWPMGDQSPMCFISQKHCKESVQYHFKDIDKGTTRIIEQYY